MLNFDDVIRDKNGKIKEAPFISPYILQYLPNNYIHAWAPDDDDDLIINIRIGIEDEQTGKLRALNQFDLRQLEIRYAWDHKNKETSKNPKKQQQAREEVTKLIVKDVKGDYNLLELIEDDPDFYTQLRNEFETIVAAQETLLRKEEENNEQNATQKKKEPFKAIIKFLPSTTNQDFIMRYLYKDNNYDPGVDLYSEGSREKKFKKALAKSVFKYLQLYDADGNLIIYNEEDDNPKNEILYEFMARNQVLFDSLVESAKNLRVDHRKKKSASVHPALQM